MTPKGRILYLVEFDAAESAVSWQVAQLAKAWQTTVVLLAVRRPRWLPMLGVEEQRATKRELLRVARCMRQLKAQVSGVRVLAGERVAETCRMADQLGAELIMVGAGAASSRGAAALSSAAYGIACRARHDVWICKPDADPHLEHVLCAADTSPLAGRALQRSAELCRRFNARLRVLSVLAEPSAQRGAAPADPDEAAILGRQQQKAFLDQFDLRGVALSRAIVWGGETAVELLLEAERYPDGLLVMGAASGPSAPGPALGLGATAEPMVRGCPSSVLVVRQRTSLAAEIPEKKPRAVAGTEVAATEPADGD